MIATDTSLSALISEIEESDRFLMIGTLSVYLGTRCDCLENLDRMEGILILFGASEGMIPKKIRDKLLSFAEASDTTVLLAMRQLLDSVDVPQSGS